MGEMWYRRKNRDDMNRQLYIAWVEYSIPTRFRFRSLPGDLFRDGSYFDIKPEVIVRPDTPQQVQQLLAIASRPG